MVTLKICETGGNRKEARDGKGAKMVTNIQWRDRGFEMAVEESRQAQLGVVIGTNFASTMNSGGIRSKGRLE